MTSQNPHDIIKLLSNDLRWQLVQALVVSDYRVGDLVTLVDHPLNLVSYHLKQLRDHELVTARRSDADGRDTYYSLNLDQLRQAFQSAGASLHPALGSPIRQKRNTPQKPAVLFVCTHNSARSQMAEGLLRSISAGQVRVDSAGSKPTRIHPQALQAMDRLGIDIRGQSSKGFEAVLNGSFDVIITVCDHAREVCPTFPGEGKQMHWGFSDPARITDPDEQQQAFMDTAERLQARIKYFLQTLE